LYIPKTLGYYWLGDKNISRNIEHVSKEKALFDKYREDLTIDDQKIASILLNYKIARIYHINMEYFSAGKYYLNVLTAFKFKRYFIKSLSGYILTLFHIKK
jgi:hypothetical protein